MLAFRLIWPVCVCVAVCRPRNRSAPGEHHDSSAATSSPFPLMKVCCRFGNTRQARLAGTRKEARVGGVAPGHRRIDYDDSYPALSSKHVPTPKSSLRPVSMLGMPGSLEVSYEGGFGNVKNGGLGPLPLFPPAPPARPSSRNSNGGRGMDTLPPLPSLGDGGNGSRSRRNSFAG